MILYYIDESGTGLGDKQTPYFVLSATMIPAQDWNTVDDEITALKRRLISWAKPEDFEIKGRDMRQGLNFFKSMNWNERLHAIHEVADTIAHLGCKIFAIQIDKRELASHIRPDDMYRLAFWRLLEEIEDELKEKNQQGMLMVDARSDLHSSVQDRRLIDAYRDWSMSRIGKTNFTELPWFGNSSFYAGLQIADFTAYLVDFVSNEGNNGKGVSPLQDAYNKFQDQVRLIYIP